MSTNDLNRLALVSNPYQGTSKRVLCVCSAGLLRSPTAALVLALEPFDFNTRSAGIESYALIPVDHVLMAWANEVVCMEQHHEELLRGKFGEIITRSNKKIITLGIPDNYEYRNEQLCELVEKRYNELSGN